jgi:phosphoadenosine phosphosulfate reductase
MGSIADRAVATQRTAGSQIVNGIERWQAEAEHWSAEELVRWGLAEFHPEVAVASSFGAEDVVLIDMGARAQRQFRVFTLDTDFLFEDTYALIDQIERRYGITVERCRSALTPEEQARQYGAALWSREPDRCCNLRKVEPLKKQLAQLDAWITGIRRDQAPTRANARKLEWDAKFELVKLNPLADWTWDQVWDYIRAHNVPYNPLHDRNYPSIGCTYCTRPVLPGEDPRAGRWSGFQKTECGLHAKTS